MKKRSVEVLVAAMNQKDISIVKAMNITTDCVLINQCDKDHNEIFEKNNQRINFISKNERGISRSRNMAIDKAKADVCLIADDDLVYSNNYNEKVVKAYEDLPDADLIIFNVESSNMERTSHIHLNIKKIGFLDCLKIYSYQISFRRSALLENDLKFDTLFGAGSIFNCGEENIFLTQCLKKGLKLYYHPAQIAIVNQDDSTWFNGYNENYFKTKGAVFYKLFSFYSLLMIWSFAIKKRALYIKELEVLQVVKYMKQGREEYKQKIGIK